MKTFAQAQLQVEILVATMTPNQINQRIAQFERAVNASASEISAIGNKSWEPIDETTESAWGKIAWELMEKMAARVYSDKMIKGSGVQGVLDHFNSFERYDTWTIDEGRSENGFGDQLMIVWDGDMRNEQTQVQAKPKVPVANIQTQEPMSLDEELETIESELEAVVVGIQG